MSTTTCFGGSGSPVDATTRLPSSSTRISGRAIVSQKSSSRAVSIRASRTSLVPSSGSASSAKEPSLLGQPVVDGVRGTPIGRPAREERDVAEERTLEVEVGCVPDGADHEVLLQRPLDRLRDLDREPHECTQDHEHDRPAEPGEEPHHGLNSSSKRCGAYDQAMGWRDWVRTVEIEPSLYAADFRRLGEQIEHLMQAGARIFHFDVGDGHFVPPVTMGPVVLRSIAPHIHELGGRVDCHLMVDDPAHHFQEIAESGGDSVTFHVEAVDDVGDMIARAREHGLQVGLAFNPGTPVELGADAANQGADLALCMSIEPGYSGQDFMENAYERIARTRELVDCFVQVDGGVKPENVRAVHEAGGDLLVVGTGIFGFEDLPRAHRRLVQALA